MIKHFYSYIVETDSLFLKIESLQITDGEKKHLKALAESNIHHAVLDTVFSELEAEDKKTFAKHLNTKDHDKIWKFLNEKIGDIEEKILNSSNSIKSELLKDIKSLLEGESP